ESSVTPMSAKALANSRTPALSDTLIKARLTCIDCHLLFARPVRDPLPPRAQRSAPAGLQPGPCRPTPPRLHGGKARAPGVECARRGSFPYRPPAPERLPA